MVDCRLSESSVWLLLDHGVLIQPMKPNFREQCARYRAMTLGEEGAMGARESTAWANNLRKTRQRLTQEDGDLSGWKINALEETPGWSWDPLEEGFLRKITILEGFADATNRSLGSIRQREEWNGYKIGMMVSSFRNRWKEHDAERAALLEALPGWAWTPQEDTWFARLEELPHGVSSTDRSGSIGTPSTRLSGS